MNLESAMFVAPIIISMIEQALKQIAPKFEAEVEKYLPTIENVAAILSKPDAAKVKAEILALQYECADALVSSQLAAASKT